MAPTRGRTCGFGSATALICSLLHLHVANDDNRPVVGMPDHWSEPAVARLVGVRAGESVEARDHVLITATELADLIQAGDPLTVLDVRWRLDEPDGRPAYLEGHIPGAVYVDLEHELSGTGPPEKGRHPLPPVDRLQAAARLWGIEVG